MSNTPDEAMQVLVAKFVQDMHDANTTRYVSAVGLVLILYDHILTFPDEVQVIWNARPSFAKKLFLLNQYLVAVSQICIAIFMNHFDSDAFPDLSCQVVFTAAFALGISSVAAGNVLVILRVITLWDRDQRIALFMALGFCTSFLSTVIFMITILHQALPGFAYVSYVHTCVSMIKSPELPGVWASSLVFESMVLLFVLWNALNRPRGQSTPLRRVLYRDGILFFTSLTSLRTANLIIAVIARPSLVMSGVFFVWAMTTLVLNRSLLNIQKASAKSTHVRLRSINSSESRHPSLSITSSKSSVQSHLHSVCVDVIPAQTGVHSLGFDNQRIGHGSKLDGRASVDAMELRGGPSFVLSGRREDEGVWGIDLSDRIFRVS